MPYSEALAARIRRVLGERPDLEEKKMFGGVAFMLGGNMVCGVSRDDLMARVGVDAFDAMIDRPGARPMDFTGRPMKGMAFVGPEGYATDADLGAWLDAALAFAATLPAKAPKPKTRSTKRAKS